MIALPSFIRRIEPDPLSRGERHRIVRIPHLFYKADNIREVGGHIRLFADRPGKGWAVYLYGEQAPGGGWALHRRWNFGLFCVHHVGPGKACDLEGWHITWAKLKIAKLHRGLSITWHLADTFSTKSGFHLPRRHRVVVDF